MAVKFFHVRIPRFVDLAFEFEAKRAGFDGLIIETKSGAQQFDDTIAQLRTYRAAGPQMAGGRYVIWGVVEKLTGECLLLSPVPRTTRCRADLRLQPKRLVM